MAKNNTEYQQEQWILEYYKSIIENPRFYIIGAFENDELIAVTSIDFKCGKLIGKIDFPAECDCPAWRQNTPAGG